MVKLILSNRQHKQIAELSMASNIVYKKALNSQGYCQFDLFLADPMADPQYINPSNYVHVFSDTADSTNFSEAEWGGPLVDDYKVNPKQGIVTCMAAGMANLLEMSILSSTANFTVGTAQDAINGLLNLSDNSLTTLGLSPYTTQPNSLFPQINNFVAGWGDSVLEDIYKICQDYAVDFDVRPDWTYAILNRQGVDNPNLVVRYGNQGNIEVDANMKLVNQELANQVTFLDNSGNSAYVVDHTSVMYYGPKSVLIQDGETYAQEDALTKAQLYAYRAAYPLKLLEGITVFDNNLLPFDQIRVGDSVMFETALTPTTYARAATPLSNNPTALALGTTNQTATTLGTALQLVQVVGTSVSPTLTHTYTLLGESTGWSEAYGLGTTNAWRSQASPGPVSGNGLLFDSTLLDNTELVAGNWNLTWRLGVMAGSIVCDLQSNIYVYHPNNASYTLAGTANLYGVTMNNQATNFAFPAVSLQNVVFNPGDKLYLDLWVNVTTNSTGSLSTNFKLNDLGTSPGYPGTSNRVVTPGYVPVTQTRNLSINPTAAATLPMLSGYNGLQRILSAEYNDRKRTMTLILGNAIYKVTRNHLHEVRLYGNGGATWGNIGG